MDEESDRQIRGNSIEPKKGIFEGEKWERKDQTALRETGSKPSKPIFGPRINPNFFECREENYHVDDYDSYYRFFESIDLDKKNNKNSQ